MSILKFQHVLVIKVIFMVYNSSCTN